MVLFWPEISALGVLFNFDNERMRPPKYPSAPLGVPTDCPGSHTDWCICEKVASDLGLDSVFCQVLRFPPSLTNGWSRISLDMAE